VRGEETKGGVWGGIGKKRKKSFQASLLISHLEDSSESEQLWWRSH